MSNIDPRARIQELTGSYWAFATFATALECGALDDLAQPTTAEHIASRIGTTPALVRRMLDVLVSADLVGRDGDRYVAGALAEAMKGPARAMMQADLASTVLQAHSLYEDGRRRALACGWRFTDPLILQAQGAASSMFAEVFVSKIMPSLDGLAERLGGESGALLDVGAGVGGIAIELARRLPKARVVGLEPADAPLSLARKNVAESGMGDRVEIRQERVETMADTSAFDLAWLPVVFLPDDVLPLALAAVHRVLRPGGWLMVPATSPAVDLRSAVMHMRQELWGGGPRSADELGGRMREQGFSAVREIPGPPGVGVSLLFAQR